MSFVVNVDYIPITVLYDSRIDMRLRDVQRTIYAYLACTFMWGSFRLASINFAWIKLLKRENVYPVIGGARVPSKTKIVITSIQILYNILFILLIWGCCNHCCYDTTKATYLLNGPFSTTVFG